MNAIFTILVVLIIIAAILLIAVVLLQNGKEGGIASNFTSANQTLGVRQTATILEKATWWLVSFILVASICTVFAGRSNTARGINDSLGSEIASQTEVTEEAAPEFEFSNPETEETPAETPAE
ncbi:MAG: preprotein translocase subunit SecG [Bacteroidales bacterium]|nr:preprotein translocase subunit SecG [Bacteroidales bacterium]